MKNVNSIYLSLGNNLPPRKTTIKKCLDGIRQVFPKQFVTSSVYLTAPYLGTHQPFYYNCCVGFVSEIQPHDLLQFCASLEKDLGRVRNGAKWQSRTIDIDILLMGNQCLSSPDLTIPHYDLQARDFVLIPLLELDQNLRNPLSGSSLCDSLKNIPGKNRTYPLRLYQP